MFITGMAFGIAALVLGFINLAVPLVHASPAFTLSVSPCGLLPGALLIIAATIATSLSFGSDRPGA